MRDIRTITMIDAAPDRVWQVLTDFPEHGRWNPFIRSISGKPRAGEKLDIQIAPPGGKGMRFRPTVLTAEPDREFRWKGRLLMPGLFDGEHYFMLEAAEGGTRFTHGERFSGIFAAMMGSSSFARIEEGFQAMNAALKSEVERANDGRRTP